jgi:arylsulfatase A-like enzyme
VGSSGTESSEGEIIPVTQYVTDFQRDQALAFLDQYGEELFFLYFSTNAVHSPSIPAPGDERLFLDYQYRERAYGEKDVSDKPEWVQKIRNVCKSLQEERDEEVRDQLRSLQAIDRAVGAIVEKIEDKGLLDKTVFIFTSDNGFMWCEHGVFSKASHYEESTRVPFLIVIPGIEPRVDEHLVIASLDIGPTIFELGEISKPTDGLSLVPLAKYHYIPWREEILLENFGTDEFGSYGQWGVWSGLRIKRTHEEWKYVEYPTGEKELYDLIADPYEEESQHNHPSYQLIVQDLSERLRKLRGLAVTVFKVPAGIVDQAYTFQLTAWGGNEPYSWDIFKGRLPEGLSLDSSSGLISGVPVKQEERRVQIRVTDSSIAKQTGKPQSYIQEFSFVISP